jgi:hypothetical protein
MFVLHRTAKDAFRLNRTLMSISGKANNRKDNSRICDDPRQALEIDAEYGMLPGRWCVEDREAAGAVKVNLSPTLQ